MMTRRLSLFSGNSPEFAHNYRPLLYARLMTHALTWTSSYKGPFGHCLRVSIMQNALDVSLREFCANFQQVILRPANSLLSFPIAEKSQEGILPNGCWDSVLPSALRSIWHHTPCRSNGLIRLYALRYKPELIGIYEGGIIKPNRSIGNRLGPYHIRKGVNLMLAYM